MTKLTFEEWYFLEPSIYKKIFSKEEALKNYNSKDENIEEKGEGYKGYKTHEALTVDGKDLHYIQSVCDGENCSDFFVTSLTNNFKSKTWYDWYSKEELERTFTRLNKSIFEFMHQELNRI